MKLLLNVAVDGPAVYCNPKLNETILDFEARLSEIGYHLVVVRNLSGGEEIFLIGRHNE